MGAFAQQLGGKPTLSKEAAVQRGGARVAPLGAQRPLTAQEAGGVRGIRQDVLQKQAQQPGAPSDLSDFLLRFGLGVSQAEEQPPQLVDIGGGFMVPIQRQGRALAAGLQAGLGGILERRSEQRAEERLIKREERQQGRSLERLTEEQRLIAEREGAAGTRRAGEREQQQTNALARIRVTADERRKTFDITSGAQLASAKDLAKEQSKIRINEFTQKIDLQLEKEKADPKVRLDTIKAMEAWIGKNTFKVKDPQSGKVITSIPEPSRELRKDVQKALEEGATLKQVIDSFGELDLGVADPDVIKDEIFGQSQARGMLVRPRSTTPPGG